MSPEDAARTRFWEVYQRVVYVRCYYQRYLERSVRIQRTIGVFVTAASLTSISGLFLWKMLPDIWTVIVIVAQLLTATSYLFPISETIWSLNKLVPEIEQLEIRIDGDWSNIEEKDTSEIYESARHYRTELLNLQQKYITGSQIIHSKRCQKLADEDKVAVFYERFGSSAEE